MPSPERDGREGLTTRHFLPFSDSKRPAVVHAGSDRYRLQRSGRCLKRDTGLVPFSESLTKTAIV